MSTLKSTSILCLIKLMQYHSADSLKSEIRKKIDLYQLCGLWLDSITIESGTMQLKFTRKNKNNIIDYSVQ